MPDTIIADLKRELVKYTDRKYRINAARFEKDKTEKWVLRAPLVRSISNSFLKRVESLSKSEILSLCDRILVSDIEIRRTIAFDRALRIHRSRRSGSLVPDAISR